MKFASLIMLLILGIWLKYWSPNNFLATPISETYLIQPNSELTILGSTNINEFQCKFDIAELKEPVNIAYNQKENMLLFSRATLHLKNRFFDCGSRPINKDFLALLQTEKYPEITLRLKELLLNNNPSNVKAVVEIEIAGVKKLYNVSVNTSHDGSFEVSGLLKLNIEDFSLKAPKKVLGLIVVDEIIDIQFKLKLTPYS